MLYPDLAARTCGFIGVFGTLITLGFMDTPEFLITPQPSYAPLEIQISVRTEQVATPNETTQPEPQPQEQEIPAEPQPEPSVEPEPNKTTPVPEVQETPKPVSSEPTTPPSSELMVKPEKTQEPNVQPPKDTKAKAQPEKRKEPAKTEKKVEKKVEKKAQPQNKPQAKPRTQPPAKTSSQAQAASQVASQTRPSRDEQVSLQRMQSQVSNLLVQEIKRKLRYPRNAIRRKLEGVVQVEFSISKGKISSFKLSKSSGHRILDDAAKKLAQGMLNMSLPFHEQDTVVIVPIKYELL